MVHRVMHEPLTDEVASEPRVYTVEEAAKELKVSEKTVRRLIDAGRLRSVLVTPRTLRIPVDAVDEFLSKEAS